MKFQEGISNNRNAVSMRNKIRQDKSEDLCKRPRYAGKLANTSFRWVSCGFSVSMLGFLGKG